MRSVRREDVCPAAGRMTMLIDIGRADYRSAHELQLRLHGLRRAGQIPDALVLVEHEPCITLGRSADARHIRAGEDELRRRGIAVHESDRGGDVTYHGPGQLVLYAVVDLGAYGRDVHEHVRRLEQVAIDVLASFGVGADRVGEYPGVWTAQGKVAAVGVSVRRWVTMHGVALNVAPDMAHFSCIVPCGIADRPVTSLRELLGHTVDMGVVRSRMIAACERVFGMTLIDVPASLFSADFSRPATDRRHACPAPETTSARPSTQPSRPLCTSPSRT